MRLIITRHGETEENKAGILMGHHPGKLSELGIEQAKKVALRLKSEKIDFIYSSDLKRSSDTAKEIAKYHPEAKLIFTPEIRERNCGELQGQKIIDINKTNPDFNSKNGETITQVYSRTKFFLENLLHLHKKGCVLLVAHDYANRNLISVLNGKKPNEIEQIPHQHNTSINIFEIDEDKNHKIHAFNCIKHLD